MGRRRQIREDHVSYLLFYAALFLTNSCVCISSVSLFAAAILFSAPGVECSIYSTCKRISQKLLRNVKKFLDLVFVELDMCPYKVVRSNCEELVIQGPEGKQDLRVVNSYPSKVMPP
jgi:hypothetical protein